MAVQYLYAMAAWSEGLQLTLTGSVLSVFKPWTVSSCSFLFFKR